MLKITLILSSLLLLYSTMMSWPIITFLCIIISLMVSVIPIYPFYYMSSTTFSMDNMSISLMALTIWISALMIIASYKIKLSKNMSNYFILLVILLTLILIMSFSSSNILMFYIWFEASLIPTMLLIMMWGYQPERLQASTYLIVYTVTASLPLLIMMMNILSLNNHMNMSMCESLNLTFNIPKMMSFFLMAAFLAKLPLFSVHLWLPKAHVEAPVAGSMILAAILLKLGGYGLMRMTWMFSANLIIFSPFLMSLALWGAILTSLMCLRQPDLKALIAYSSIGHMGMLIAGTMSMTKMGLYGSLSMMIAHGLSSSALFSMANISYETSKTRSIVLTKGILFTTPVLSLLWFILASSNMAAPPSINLLSEIILMHSTFSSSYIFLMMILFTSFITAAYSLYLYTTTNHGPMALSSNPASSLKSNYLLLQLNHIWPIIMLMLFSSSILSWC